jgi:hypothetical protein
MHYIEPGILERQRLFRYSISLQKYSIKIKNEEIFSKIKKYSIIFSYSFTRHENSHAVMRYFRAKRTATPKFWKYAIWGLFSCFDIAMARICRIAGFLAKQW